jgi:hypothetical protein
VRGRDSGSERFRPAFLRDAERAALLDPCSARSDLPDDWLEYVSLHPLPGWCTQSRRVLACLDSDFVVPLACRSWLCPGCQRDKWNAARTLFEWGISDAWKRGERVRFFTLTDGSPRGDMTIEQVSHGWNKLARMLRDGGPAPRRPAKGAPRNEWERWWRACRARTSYLNEYAMVLEVGRRGDKRLHVHVLCTGAFIPQRKLSRMARLCGFGRVTDIQEVEQTTEGHIAAYAAKMAGYVSKTGQEAQRLAERARVRLRPIRVSRGWCDGGLRGVEEALGIRGREKPMVGRWVIVEHDGGHPLIGRRWERFRVVGENSAKWRSRG